MLRSWLSSRILVGFSLTRSLNRKYVWNMEPRSVLGKIFHANGLLSILRVILICSAIPFEDKSAIVL